MAANTIIQAVDRQQWLEPIADALQRALSSAFKGAGEPGQKLKNCLHGTWLGHPLHPVLTDIPLGSWTAALVLDALDEISGRKEFARGADVAVAVGLVGAVCAAITGLTDWKETDGRARKIGVAHGLLNLSGALLYGTSWCLRRREERSAGRGFSLLGFVVAASAAYLGGHLVYREQIGVDHSAGQTPPEEFVPVLPEAELLENQLRRVDANGARVLLARRNGQIYALTEVCSHLGGPLAEGKLECSSVRCPWHASRFSLQDGSVLDGPATHPQPVLEARVNQGQIEVRMAKR